MSARTSRAEVAGQASSVPVMLTAGIGEVDGGWPP
jgi:hypothetical protein